jgi:putative glutamine amidotransferase
MKKKIGISFPKTKFEFYWNWFTPEDLQDEIELIKLSFEENNVEDIYKCDGFVLTGGVDIDPSFYEGSNDYKNNPGIFQPERDRFESKIYRYSQLKNLPVLGICRGMQLVNVMQGGKLIQDLDTGNKKHNKEENTDNEHRIITQEDTLLYEITGNLSGHVNSAHHQSVDPNSLGTNLKVNAYDDDANIIEGLEFSDKTGKAFMLCVQWHPERMKDKEENPFSKNLKDQFISAVKQSTAQKNADH